MLTACPHCGESAQAGKYCSNCGTKVEKTCRSCSAANAPDARFCAECGTAFEALAKAPQPSDLDAVGSAAEAGHRPVRRHLRLDRADRRAWMREDASRRPGSRPRHHRQGDGALRRRGEPPDGRWRHGPVRRPDRHRGPCRPRLLCRSRRPRGRRSNGRISPCRSGSACASGPVILRRTGRDDQDYDVAGITVHIAARLEQQAEPRTILLAQQTGGPRGGRRPTARSIGRMALKGIAEPLPVFRLLSAADRPSWSVRAGAQGVVDLRRPRPGDEPARGGHRPRRGRTGAGGRAGGRRRHGQIAPAARVPRQPAARHVAYRARRDHGPVDGHSLLPDHRPAARFRRLLAGRQHGRDRQPPALGHRLAGPRRPTGYDAASRPSRQGSGGPWRAQPRPAQSPPGALDAPDPAALCRPSPAHPGGRGLSLARRLERGGAFRAVRRDGYGAPPPAGDDAPGTPRRLPQPQHDRGRAPAPAGPAMPIACCRSFWAARTNWPRSRAHIIERADGTPLFLEEFARSLHRDRGARQRRTAAHQHRHSGVGAIHPGGAHRPPGAAAQAPPPDRRRHRPRCGVALARRPPPTCPKRPWRTRSPSCATAGFLVEVRLADRHRSQLLARPHPGGGLRQPAAQRPAGAARAGAADDGDAGPEPSRRCGRPPGAPRRPGGRVARGRALCAGGRRARQPPLGDDRGAAPISRRRSMPCGDSPPASTRRRSASTPASGCAASSPP